MSMLVAPFIATFADAAVRVTDEEPVTIGDVAWPDGYICINAILNPLAPSPVKVRELDDDNMFICE